MTKVSFLLLEYVLLAIGWCFLYAMQVTVFINGQLFKTEEYIFRMHRSLKTSGLSADRRNRETSM